jgi:hypothetical protein
MRTSEDRLQWEEEVLDAIDSAQNSSHAGAAPMLQALADRMLEGFVEAHRQGIVSERDDWWSDTFLEMLSVVYFHLTLAEIKRENFKEAKEFAWRAAELKTITDESYLDACNNLFLHATYSHTDEDGYSVGYTSINLVDRFLDTARTFNDRVKTVLEYHTPYDPAAGLDVVYRVVTKMSYEHEKFGDYASFEDALAFCARTRDGFRNPPYIPELPDHMQPDAYYVVQEDLKGTQYSCKMKSYGRDDETITMRIVEISPNDAKYW